MKTVHWGQMILLVLLVTAVPVPLLAVLNLLAPAWPWLIVTLLCLLTAVEAVTTTLWLHHYDQLGLNKPYYRAAEFMVIAVLARLFAWSVAGNWPQAVALRSYLLEPWLLLDGYYFIILLILFSLWSGAISFTNIFHHLAISQAESAYYDQSRPGSDRPMPLNRVLLVETFFQRWVVGGLFLIICTALTTFNLAQLAVGSSPLAIGRLGLRWELLLVLLVYFLSGLWLLSQARLSVMRARWLTGRVTKQAPVERSWFRTSLTTLLVVAGLSAFLPIGSTPLISRIVNTLIFSLLFVLNMLVVLFGSLVVAVFSLFRPSSVEEELVENFVVPQAMMPGGELIPPNEFAGLIAGSIFWLGLFVVAIFAFVFFLRERRYRRFSWRQMWRGLRLWLREWWSGVAEQVARWQPERSGTIDMAGMAARRLPWSFVRVNSLSPRQQIYYFYLSTLQRASRQGLPRQRGETPLEYAQDLHENWPETTADVGELTDAFLKARYSPAAIETEEVTAVKPIWKRLRNALTQRKASRQKPV